MTQERIADIFSRLGSKAALAAAKGLAVAAPASGAAVACLAEDTPRSLDEKITRAAEAQKRFAMLPRRERAALVASVASAIKEHRESLAQCVHIEGGKTIKEGLVEADGSAAILLKTIDDATLPEVSGMLRCKERPAVGNVGLITSFNFPMVVAYWTIAPALLAGNAVIWKPSEKTPLTALACKAVFDKAAGQYADLLQVVIGGRDIGQALVAHAKIGMVSATGSVGMGKAIMKTLAAKSGNIAAPILELGGNNGAIISEHMSDGHLAWSLSALMNSFLGTTGQRCTNTRRLFVHASLYEKTASILKANIEAFIKSAVKGNGIDPDNAYGYGALIDEDAFRRFEHAKKQAAEEGGKIVLGGRLLEKEFPGAYYVEPALALMPKQTAIMHEETFAPLLFVTPYKGDIGEATALVNAPANAGLVGAIYTQSQKEADRFALLNEAGHSLINSPKGTGTPAYGMGFGGNKDSGTGEILNSADPLQAFTRPGAFRRIAQNKDIAMKD